MTTPQTNGGPLSGLRVLDLSRILAGPSQTQLFGDLGAEIIKIEHPDGGDDTRKWGPPFLQSADDDAPNWSSYYLSINRNKRSVAIDLASPGGQDLIRKLALKCDVLIENFKVGGLKKYGLSYEDLAADHPGLIYCSITGFGQSGPICERPGYDAMIQAMGGIMSITGAADGEPMKVGVGIADIMTGMYAGVAILAALRHRDATGEGQHIDIALLDCQVAWLTSEGMNYLLSGKTPVRSGSAHPNIVPYQVMPTSDGHFMLAVGNDGQFRRFCIVAGAEEIADDPRYATNPARVKHRDVLISLLRDLTQKQDQKFWIDELSKANVPCGPINDIAQVFDEPQVKWRGMRLNMQDPRIKDGNVDLIANPIKFSKTPVSYRTFPPQLGEHTTEVLEDVLGMDSDQIDKLVSSGVVKR